MQTRKNKGLFGKGLNIDQMLFIWDLAVLIFLPAHVRQLQTLYIKNQTALL